MTGAFLTAAQPFAWTLEDGSSSTPGADDSLNPRRVTQCALSRICGVCAEPLGRPIVFLGNADEAGRNAYHAPPLHEACASELLARLGPDHGWEQARTSGFEFVRPGRDDLDRAARFVPNSLL